MTPLISKHHKQLDTAQRLLTPMIEARRQEVAEEKEGYVADQGVSN